MNARFLLVLLSLSSCVSAWSKVGSFHYSRMNGLAYSAEMSANSAVQARDGITSSYGAMSDRVELMRSNVTDAEAKAAAFGGGAARTAPAKKSSAAKKKAVTQKKSS